MVDKQTFLDKMKEIGTCEDDVQRRTLLAEVQNDVSEVFDTNEELEEKNKTLTEDNETVRAANMKLFLQVGSQNEEGTDEGSKTGKKDEPEKLNFEDLLDDKGGLK